MVDMIKSEGRMFLNEISNKHRFHLNFKGNKQRFNVTVNGSNYDNISVEEDKNTVTICVDDDSSFVIAHLDVNKTNSYAFRNVCADIEILELNQSTAKQIVKSVGKGCIFALRVTAKYYQKSILKVVLLIKQSLRKVGTMKKMFVLTMGTDTERDRAKVDILEKGIHFICISYLSLDVERFDRVSEHCS